MKNGLKWLACCLLVTLPYNLKIFSELNKFSSLWQIIAYIIGSLLSFSLFITVFFCLDKWLINRGYTKFRSYFLKAFGLKIMGFVLLFTSPRFFKLFYMIMANIFESGDFNSLLQANILKTANYYFDLYELLQKLLVVPILLLGEMMLLLIAIAIIWRFESSYHRLKNGKNA